MIKYKNYKMFLFIEDGSVDVCGLEEELRHTNPDIKIIVYRQGSPRPELINISTEVKE